MNTVFLGLHPTNLGSETREMTNPFTGEKLTAHVGDAATEAQFSAGVAVLDNAGGSESDPDGFRTVELGGDRYLSVNFGRKGTEINIEGGLEMDAVAFVYDLAAASAMLVTSTIDPKVVAVLPGHRHPGIAERWPEAADVDSAESLYAWIKKEITNRRIA